MTWEGLEGDDLGLDAVVGAGKTLTKLLDAKLSNWCFYEAAKLLFCLVDIFAAALFINMCRFEKFVSKGVHLV